MGMDNDFLVSLKIGTDDYGYWDQHSGGAYDADEQKYTPYDGVQRTYISKKNEGNVTLSRDYRPGRDGAILSNKERLQGELAVVVVLDKDTNGNTQQNRPPTNGIVKAITPPDTDSDGTTVAKISIEISAGILAG